MPAMRAANKSRSVVLAAAAAILIAAAVGHFLGYPADWLETQLGLPSPEARAPGADSARSGDRGGGDRASSDRATSSDSVNLSDSQLAWVKVEPVSEREFPIEKQAVGSIDFNEEMSVQVFTPYPGRIIGLFAK